MAFKNELRFAVESGKPLVIRLTKSLTYTQPGTGRVFVVPNGFKCDLASVPKILRSIATPWHQSASPGVLHDCGVRWNEIWHVSRKDMDELYRQALIAQGVSRWRAWLQKRGVRLFGRSAWENWRQTSVNRKGVKPQPIKEPS